MEKGTMTLYRRNHFQVVADNDLWQYALKLYAKEGVSKACIALQEEFLLNVNVILACCWFAATGRGTVSKNIFNNLLSNLNPWNEKITRELRTLRRQMTELDQDSNNGMDKNTKFELKNQALQLELYSEKAQQAILFDYLCGYNKIRRGQQRTKDAMTNMQHYFSVSKIILNESGYESSRLILAAAFENFQDRDFPQLNLGL
jgi:uncharacterized protein (TIGR02444 family)